jgi:hypothetical protein
MKSLDVRRIRHTTVLAAVAFAFATPLVAQVTLLYRTTEEGTVFMDSPMGAMEVQAEGYGEVRFEVDGTSAVATYDTIFSYVGGTMGDQSPDVTPLRDGTFELSFERPGVVKTLSHPSMGASGAGGIDPLHSFDDFFVPLPDESLAVGVEWSETLINEGSSQPGATYYMERAMTMKVERDTVVNGVPAFVVSVAQEVSTEATGVMEAMGAEFMTSSDGTDNGTAIFAADGTLLYRDREVNMNGLFSIGVQGQAFDMPQTMSFTGSTELIPDK